MGNTCRSAVVLLFMALAVLIKALQIFFCEPLALGLFSLALLAPLVWDWLACWALTSSWRFYGLFSGPFRSGLNSWLKLLIVQACARKAAIGEFFLGQTWF